MVIKFFISDTCPSCLPVKDLFYKLEQQYVPTYDRPIRQASVNMFNLNNELDKSQFLYYSVQAVPTVIVCTNDMTEVFRLISDDICKKLMSLI